ncbi:transposase [Streptomyces spiralis]
MASAAPGGAGPTRGPGRGGLDLGDRRRGLRSRQKVGSLTGPTPVDRGKKGSKLHVLSDAQGIPLAVAVSGANMHDSLALEPLIRGIPAVRSRRGATAAPTRRTPRGQGVLLRRTPGSAARARARRALLARPGIESGEPLGRHRAKRSSRNLPCETPSK